MSEAPDKTFKLAHHQSLVVYSRQLSGVRWRRFCLPPRLLSPAPLCRSSLEC